MFGLALKLQLELSGSIVGEFCSVAFTSCEVCIKNFTYLAANVQRQKWMSTNIILLWEDFGSYEVSLCKYMFRFIAYIIKKKNQHILFGKLTQLIRGSMCVCVT